MKKTRGIAVLLALCLAVSLLVLPAGAADTSTFSDVTDRGTAMDLETLRLLGVLDGYQDGTFRPKNILTRAQFCKMTIHAVNGSKELGKYQSTTVFPDVKPSYWAASYINMASKGRGIILGYADGYFRPDNTVTFGQATAILMRLLGYKDSDVGAVWPDGYLAEAAAIGLTDGIKLAGSAPLSRGNAAKLFTNLLRCKSKEGGAYAATIATLVPDVILVSCNAVAEDGTTGAMRMADGTVYPMAHKSGSGILNGQKGTLLLDGSGRVLTFVPLSGGSSRTLLLASCTSAQISSANGVKYAVSSATPCFCYGESHLWGEVFSWLQPGTTLTLYVDPAGKVTYIVAGSSTESEAAVIVSQDGSAAGIDALCGGAKYTIYKNGAPATAADLKKYDVATWSAESGTVRVCDTRVSVYYESCTPSPAAPETITVLGGTEFSVLPSAMESLAQFKPGQRMILLLTEGGRVAGALPVDSAAGQPRAIGVVKDGKVELLCGTSLVKLNCKANEKLEGQLVSIYAQDRNEVTLNLAKGGVTGDLDAGKRTLGTTALADNVRIYDNGRSIGIADLLYAKIPAREIVYARTDWSGKIDLIELSTQANGMVFYGRVKSGIGTKYDEMFGSMEMLMLEVEYAKDGAKATSGVYSTNYTGKSGVYAEAVLRGDFFMDVTELTCLKKVPNSAWIGKSAVNCGGQTYAVAADVSCYNRDSQSWTTLDAAHGYSMVADLYVKDGIVRVIEVGS